MVANLLRQELKRIIYRLKRDFGVKISLSKIDSRTRDLVTGAMAEASTDTVVTRAAVLPRELLRDFSYDLTYIAANKNFTYGAVYNEISYVILIDSKDLPSGYVLNLEDKIIFNGRRLSIFRATPTVDHKVYMVLAKDLEDEESVS